MPKKQSTRGRPYKVDGKRFIWHPLDDNDEAGNLPDVSIPLRIKLKLIYAMGDGDLTPKNMKDMLDVLIPNQADTLGEMDLHDFEDMFTAWQAEYQLLSGASLGESSRSPA